MEGEGNSVTADARKRKLSSAASDSSLKDVSGKSLLRKQIANAALLGLCIRGKPSLIQAQENENPVVIRAREQIKRFLKRHVRSVKRKEVKKANTLQPSIAPFTWLVPLLTRQSTSSSIKDACAHLLTSSLDGGELVLVDHLMHLLSSYTQADPVLELLTQVMTKSSDAVRRVAVLGGARLGSSRLAETVADIVQTDLSMRTSQALGNRLKLVASFLGSLVKEPSLKSTCQRDMHLLQAVASVEAVQLGENSLFETAKKLRQLFTTIEYTPEQIVREAGSALHQFVSGFGKKYSECFPYVLASSIVLNDVVNTIVPKYKVPDITLQLQRAATQEEYFRGGLNKSSIQLADVPSISSASSDEPPRVQDLRQKIATELGMASSLEMFELVVAGKILGPELELARVYEQIWRPHVAERSKGGSSSRTGAVPSGMRRLLSDSAGGSGGSNPPAEFGSLSGMLYRSAFPRFGDLADQGGVVISGTNIGSILSSQVFPPSGVNGIVVEEEDEDDDEDDEDGGGLIFSQHHEGEDDEDDDESNHSGAVFMNRSPSSTAFSTKKMYPPMVITYRLCAVDGEATEDFVSSLPSTPLGEEKKDFLAATRQYGDDGLRALINLVSLCVENTRNWPFPVALELLSQTLMALDQCVTNNIPCLLKLGALPVLLKCLVDSTSDLTTNHCLSILDRLVSGSTEELEEQAFIGGDSAYVGTDQMDWVLERLDSFSSTKPKLVSALAKITPHLIYGRAEKAKQLANELNRAVAEKSWTLQVIENLSTSGDALLLREALFEFGVAKRCVDQINVSTLETFMEHAALPETLISLRLLKGLVKGHLKTAELICSSPALATIVRLEEISSTKVENVGSYAFAVLEALSAADQMVKEQVAKVQKARKEELRQMAMKKRNKAMKLLNASAPGAPTNSASVSNKKQKRWVDELQTLEEEDSNIVCIVCHEGYRSKPNQLMCTYTFEKSIMLPLGSYYVSTSGQVRNNKSSNNSASSSSATEGPVVGPSVWGLCSSSAFVCIHQSCHEAAARADRSHPKAPKDEWEGAELRNGHIRCNNLIPLRGTVQLPLYEAAVHAFFERIDRDTKVKVSSASFANDPSLFSVIAHDLKTLLLRISFGESLTDDTRGGSIESNLKLVVPLLQMGMHLLSSDGTHRSSVETLLATFISSKDTCNLPFASVLAAFCLDADRWNEIRISNFLKVIPSHVNSTQQNIAAGDFASVGSGANASGSGGQQGGAGAAAAAHRARSRSRARSLSVNAAAEAMELHVVDDVVSKHTRPWLIFFGLIDRVLMNSRPQMLDKAALEATQQLAQDARTMLGVCHSVAAMAPLLRLTSEQLKDCLM